MSLQRSLLRLFFVCFFSLVFVTSEASLRANCVDAIRAWLEAQPDSVASTWPLREEALEKKVADSGVRLIHEMTDRASEDPEVFRHLRALAETRKLSDSQLQQLIKNLKQLAERSYDVKPEPESRLRAMKSLGFILSSFRNQLPEVNGKEGLAFWLVQFMYKLVDDPHFRENESMESDEVSWIEQMLFATLSSIQALVASGKCTHETLRYLRSEMYVFLEGEDLNRHSGSQAWDALLRDVILATSMSEPIPSEDLERLRKALLASQNPSWAIHARRAALEEMVRILDRYFILNLKDLHKLQISLQELVESSASGGFSQRDLDRVKDLLQLVKRRMDESILALETWVNGSEVSPGLSVKIFTPPMAEPVVRVLFESLLIEDLSGKMAGLIRELWERELKSEREGGKIARSIAQLYSQSMDRLHAKSQRAIAPSDDYARAIDQLEEIRLSVGFHLLAEKVRELLPQLSAEAQEEVKWLLASDTETLLLRGHHFGVYASMEPNAFLRAMREFSNMFRGSEDRSIEGFDPFMDEPGSIATSSGSGRRESLPRFPGSFDGLIVEGLQRLQAADSGTETRHFRFVAPLNSSRQDREAFLAEVRRYAALYYIYLQLRLDVQGQAFDRIQWQTFMGIYREARRGD